MNKLFVFVLVFVFLFASVSSARAGHMPSVGANCNGTLWISTPPDSDPPLCCTWEMECPYSEGGGSLAGGEPVVPLISQNDFDVTEFIFMNIRSVFLYHK